MGISKFIVTELYVKNNHIAYPLKSYVDNYGMLQKYTNINEFVNYMNDQSMMFPPKIQFNTKYVADIAYKLGGKYLNYVYDILCAHYKSKLEKAGYSMSYVADLQYNSNTSEGMIIHYMKIANPTATVNSTAIDGKYPQQKVQEIYLKYNKVASVLKNILDDENIIISDMEVLLNHIDRVLLNIDNINNNNSNKKKHISIEYIADAAYKLGGKYCRKVYDLLCNAVEEPSIEKKDSKKQFDELDEEDEK